MKFTAIILLSACLTASAKGYSQKVSLSGKNVPLEKMFSAIETQTNYVFFYNYELLNDAKAVSIEVKDVSLQDALKLLFKDQPLDFVIKQQTVFITKKNPATNIKEEIPLPPPITVRGRVVNENGEPVVATVLVKGTNNGTTSNADGYFELKNVDESATLVITGVSIKPIEVKVNGKVNISITVKIAATEGEDVVVKTNYWETKQRLNPGNISKVTAKEIEKNPVSNPLAALQARVTGLEIVQQTGVPGGNFKVRIRGTNSIANGNDPLYIIDGVPYISNSMSFLETSGNIIGNPSQVAGQGSSPLNSLNPADIESIEVLKDADATAIYGSRGSNGVILITTKKGKPGKTKMDFNFYSGAAKVKRMKHLLNTQEYLEMRHEAFANDNIVPTTSNARDLLVWDATRYTDWQKILIGETAQTTDAQLSFSGGDKNTQFLIGGGYHRETTVFPGDNEDQRVSVHSSITNNSLNQKLKTLLSVNYSVNATNLLRQDLTSKALLLPPNAPALYDASGNLTWTNWSSSFENPLAYTKRIYENKTNNLIANAGISYVVLPNLELKSSLGYTNIISKAITTNPISSQFPDPGAQNSSSFSSSSFQNWVIEPQLNWKPITGENQFDLLVGTTFLEQASEGLAQTGYGFSSEALMKNLSSATTRTLGTNYYSQYRYQALFGRLNYSFKKRYIVNLTGRRDGSSRFGSGKQFANFGALGLAWIFSEENFIKKTLPFISYGKLRSSYGTSGNDQLGDYKYLDTYSSSSGQYLGGIGLAPDRLSNPDYAWETNRKFEAGLELGFFNDRILSSLSFYRNRSSNQLVGFPLPATTGFSSIQGNFPATVQNTGFEIELTTKNIQTTSFSWTTSFNISIPHNKLVEFPNIGAFPAYANTYVVGQPLNIRKLYNYTGINGTTGIYMFEDVNGDGSYDFKDRQTIRFIGQNFYGGLQNSFQYKNFQIDVLFQFVKQAGNNYILFFDTPGLLANLPDFVLNRWKSIGDNTETQRFSQTGTPLTAYSRLTASQQSVSDASFIRLKNLSISYSLPQLWLQKMGIVNARLFIHGQNLLTITNYKGLDPEVQSSTLPPLKVITAGINLIF